MRHFVFLPLMGSLLLSACTAPAIKDANLARMSATEQAKSSNQTPQEVIDQAKSQLKTAETENLAFFSPTYLAEAQKEIEAAQRALLAGEEASTATANALLAQQWITRGLNNKAQVQVKLKASLDALAVLDEIKAQQFITNDYQEFKQDIKELVVLIEQERVDEAVREQNDVLEAFAELEIATLRAAYLKPVLAKLEEAEDQDADDYAETTLADAQQQATALDTYIKTNPRNRDQIATLSKQASKAAMHAKQVALAVRPLLKLNHAKAEKHILAIEQYLARIGSALNHEDVRHMSLDNQSIAIAQVAETTARRAKAFDRQQDWEKQKSTLTEKVSLLEVALATSKAQLEEARKAVIVNVAPVKPAEPTAEQTTSALPITDTSNGMTTQSGATDTLVKKDALEKEAAKPANLPKTANSSTAKPVTAKPQKPLTDKPTVTDNPQTPTQITTDTVVSEAKPAVKEPVDADSTESNVATGQVPVQESTAPKAAVADTNSTVSAAPAATEAVDTSAKTSASPSATPSVETVTDLTAQSN